MNSSKVNININGDDHNINDYLYCWSELGERPNRIVLYDHYESDSFKNLIIEEGSQYQGIFTEVIPTESDYMVNDKVLIKIADSIYVSFTQFDKLTEENIIGEVSFIYSNESSLEINKILSKLNEISVDITFEDDKRVNCITIGQNGLDLDPISLMKADYENIELYFNDETIKSAEKLIKKIKKSSKGLTIIHGERGTGKTTLVNHISSNLDKVVIFIPCSMIEHTINNPDFRNFIKRYKNSTIILDDTELYFSEIYSKSNIFTNNLLQLVDGFQSDDLDINIITILNVESIDQIDHTLIDCNNLIDIIEVEKLTKERAHELASHLGNKSKSKIKNSIKLIDVLKKRDFNKNIPEIGFN